jgi:hypothetical protein
MPAYNTLQNQAVPNIAPDPQAALWGILGLQGNQGSGGAAQNYLEDPQAVLQRVLQFDPNAHLSPFTYYGPEGVENRQQVVYDQSKLPQPSVPGAVFAGPTPLFDQNAVTRDPNYGMVTSPVNLNLHQNERSWLDWAGPLAVSLFTGGLAGPSLLGSVLGKLPNVASMASNAFTPQQQFTPQQLMLMRLLSSNRGS